MQFQNKSAGASLGSPRRRTGLRVALATALLACGVAHAADPWPTKQPVRIVVPFTPGGTSDTLGRLVAQKLTESMKQTFVVENRPGAGGVIGSDFVSKAAPDGYTLVVSGVASHAIAPSLSKKFPYDPIKDFTHIALFGGPPNVLAVNNNVPAKTLKEFIAYAKSQPGKLNYGSPGNGTMGHLFAEQLNMTVGIDLSHVPYKGAGPAVGDLMAGHIPVISTTLTTAAGQIKAGKARAIAISSRSRVPDFPDVPTFAELGYPAATSVTWFSLSGPPGLPQEIVTKLNTEVRRILQLPDVREKLRPEGIEPGNLDPKAFTEFVGAEIKRWAPVVKASGATID
ncbi:MAG: Tripartite-type tricarboxylate transporter, receptor component TctC [Ramlibacter sp.]|nr:Tripartite-type tricarboxylate transporter, receptor component TctC [Ramlibacter sp.]